MELPSLYWLGVLFAVLNGVIGNMGLLIQKKVIVGLPDDVKFMRSLIKNPKWVFGLILNFGVSSIFFFFAQLYIGPTLVPGLMDIGIIVLAIGSVKIIGDQLKKIEWLAIILMISSTFFLSFSGLSIEITETDFLEINFIVRFTIFTLVFFTLAVAFGIYQKYRKRGRGILLAIISGLMFSLSDFWVAPVIGSFDDMITGFVNIGTVILFIISLVIIIFTNAFGIINIQKSFKQANASHMITIQQIPLNITPIIMYLLIFLLIPPTMLSIFLLIGGSILIIMSSLILSKRQLQLDELK